MHRELGPGLLESAYQAAMAHELGLINFHVPVPKSGVKRIAKDL